jgi:cysteine desulfurase/selenocysteine lyase
MLDDQDILEIRKDFPLLSTQMNGKPLVYLDNAATTQKPWLVINRIRDYYTTFNATVHRGFYALSERATFAMEEVRENVAQWINAHTPSEIVFTSGATESSNVVVHGLENFLEQGDEVLLGELEHNSQAAPWLDLMKKKELNLHFISFTQEGIFSLEDLKNKLTPQTKVMAITFVSNFLGTIQPIKEMVLLARAMNPSILIILDAAQAVPYFPVDVQALGADFLFFSAHKMLAPMGVGILWGKQEKLELLSPFKKGGGALAHIQDNDLIFKDLPQRLEAGTPNVEGIIGLGAALEYLDSVGMRNIAHYEEQLKEYLDQELLKVPSFARAVLEGAPRLAMATGHLTGLNSHDVVAFLDAKGIAVRSGSLCSYLITRALDAPPVVRASLYFYNTEQEIEILREALLQTERILRC